MAEPGGQFQRSGAARRRRERRLRSMLRHEQQTFRMALAAALHHSAGPKEEGWRCSRTAPHGDKTAARAREEVVNATHDALRGQNTPPGILAEPGPQRSDPSLRRSAGDTHPTLGLPVLAGASGEVVDASTLAFLTRAVLEEKRKDEVEKAAKVKVKVKEERWEWQRRQALRQELVALLDLSEAAPLGAAGEQDQRDPPARAGRQGCRFFFLPAGEEEERKRRGGKGRGGRPCEHARQVPAVLRVPGPSDSVPRLSVGHSSYGTETGISVVFLHRCSSWIWFLRVRSARNLLRLGDDFRN